MPDKATTLILFGATGDLAARMLLPSLYALDRDGLLPDGLRIVATARSAHDDASFRAHAVEALRTHVPAAFIDPDATTRFAVMRSTADDAEAGASAMLHAMEAEQA
jgi:glucose-6-phosphate 1-dehydrogenase